MSDTVTTGAPEPWQASSTLSRRRVLQLGLAAIPAVCGAGLLSGALATSDDVVRGAELEPAGGTYDPSAHDLAFVMDTTICICCGRCVEACKLENHVPEDPELNRTWVELHVLAKDWTVTVSSPAGGADGTPAQATVPAVADAAVRNAYFVPRTCMQCENPPCTLVCPVSATYRTEDGVILVDEKRCIGCGYCVVACPYGARYMVPAGDTTPRGVPGIADKCTFCYHRITRGLLPACAEVCPVNARVFGDLKDATSPVSVAVSEKRVRAMKPALWTRPRVFYMGLEGEVD